MFTFPDEDFLDLIDQAFLDKQINGETMVLAYLVVEELIPAADPSGTGDKPAP